MQPQIKAMAEAIRTAAADKSFVVFIISFF